MFEDAPAKVRIKKKWSGKEEDDGGLLAPSGLGFSFSSGHATCEGTLL